MRAYAESYLFGAMETLGDAFDAAEACGLGSQRFLDLFVQTGLAEQFGCGAPRVIAGLSGSELVAEACERAGLAEELLGLDGFTGFASVPYWCGWILAYLQWEEAYPFELLVRCLPVSLLEELYHPLHEASEERAAETLASYLVAGESALGRIRRARGLTQAELAERSDVSLRAIQQYEQRVKDIRRGQAQSLWNLAATLGCTIDDLLEG